MWCKNVKSGSAPVVIMIGNDVVIHVEARQGHVKLSIDAPREKRIEFDTMDSSLEAGSNQPR